MRSAGGHLHRHRVPGRGLFADGPALESNSQAVSKLAAPTNVSPPTKESPRKGRACQPEQRQALPAGRSPLRADILSI